MLANDGRECAKALNAVETDFRHQRQVPIIQVPETPSESAMSEVLYHGFHYLYGHYDSRGGAMLVEAAHLMEAHQRYLEMCGWEENASDVLVEDFMGRFEAIFLDDKRSRVPDMKTGWDILEEDYASYRVECFSPYSKEWHKLDGVVFVPKEIVEVNDRLPDVIACLDGNWPAYHANAASHNVRLVEWDLGEDACGCVWCPKAINSKHQHRSPK